MIVQHSSLSGSRTVITLTPSLLGIFSGTPSYCLSYGVLVLETIIYYVSIMYTLIIMEYTMVRIEKSTAELIKTLRLTRSESYNDIIIRLIQKDMEKE